MTSEESIAAAVRSLDGAGFSPNVLVNNAGVTKDQLLLRASRSDVEGVLQTNLVGTMMLTKALLKGMLREKGDCSIVRRPPHLHTPQTEHNWTRAQQGPPGSRHVRLRGSRQVTPAWRIPSHPCR